MHLIAWVRGERKPTQTIESTFLSSPLFAHLDFGSWTDRGCCEERSLPQIVNIRVTGHRHTHEHKCKDINCHCTQYKSSWTNSATKSRTGSRKLNIGRVWGGCPSTELSSKTTKQLSRVREVLPCERCGAYTHTAQWINLTFHNLGVDTKRGTSLLMIDNF